MTHASLKRPIRLTTESQLPRETASPALTQLQTVLFSSMVESANTVLSSAN